MIEDPHRREALFHSILVDRRNISVASRNAEKKLRTLLFQYGSFEGIFQSFYPKISIEDFLKINNLSSLEKKIERVPSFKLSTVLNDTFPPYLKEALNLSPVLYYRGDFQLLQKKIIAVVGTRELYDELDKKEGINIVHRLLEKEYAIISGLARGCDTLAHRSTLEKNGKTLAVLGTSIEKYYPYENTSLQEQIAQEGLILSQYPLGLRSFPSYFAHRNLLMVSLASEGVVVIRADDKSGTQHAIKECLAQNKSLYVLENNLHQGYCWTEKHRDRLKIPNRKS